MYQILNKKKCWSRYNHVHPKNNEQFQVYCINYKNESIPLLTPPIEECRFNEPCIKGLSKPHPVG